MSDDRHSPFYFPLKTLFGLDHDAKPALKPASSSPADILTRTTVPTDIPEFDPNKVALPREASDTDILREIRDILRDMRPNPPADNFRPMALQLLDTTGSEKTIDVTGGYEWLYIPPVSRAVTVYWRSMSWPLLKLNALQSATIHIPYRMDEFSLSWGAGALNDVIYLIFTTDELSVKIT